MTPGAGDTATKRSEHVRFTFWHTQDQSDSWGILTYRQHPDIVRRDAKTDWNYKEQVRAKLRTTIKRLLRKHGYPPDKTAEATQLVIEQAEVIATYHDDEVTV